MTDRRIGDRGWARRGAGGAGGAGLLAPPVAGGAGYAGGVGDGGGPDGLGLASRLALPGLVGPPALQQGRQLLPEEGEEIM